MNLSSMQRVTLILTLRTSIWHDKLHCTLLNFREITDLDIAYESSTKLPTDCSHEISFLIWFLGQLGPNKHTGSEKTAKDFKNIVCFCGHANRVGFIITQEMWDYCHGLSIDTDQGKKHFKWIPSARKFFVILICFLLKLCTMLHNTEPDICDLWHAKSIYFRSTDTLHIQWPFP